MLARQPSPASDRLGRLLLVTLEAARVDADLPVLAALRSWLDSWRGISERRARRGAPGLRPPAHPLRRAGLARDLLHKRDGALDHERRLFCVLLALSAWAIARRPLAVSAGPPWRAWAADGGRFVLGLLLILPFAFISSHKILGQRPYYEQVAESKARLQLGADYADYQYFARRVDSVFHTGVSVTIRASLVAYNTALNDVQEVAVTWKEPWTGTR